jgi:hypothetical protein
MAWRGELAVVSVNVAKTGQGSWAMPVKRGKRGDCEGLLGIPEWSPASAAV